MLKVMPYKIGSISAKSIAKHFAVKRVHTPTFISKARHIILNWGRSAPINPANIGRWQGRMINKFTAVANASCKLKTLRILTENGVRCPLYFASASEAQSWLDASPEGSKLYSRGILNGCKGRGITIVRKGQRVGNERLHTVSASGREYRLHVFNINGEYQVIDAVVKKKMSEQKLLEMGITEVNKEIKNFENGWVFTRGDLVLFDTWKEEAIKAVKALGLDFGAVDMTVRDDIPCILEVNTSPGMKPGLTVHKAYVRAISTILGITFNEEEYNRRYDVNQNGDPSDESGNSEED
jgi:hypothetical protein